MDLSVTIGQTTFKNPIWVAAGTFGYAKEFEDFLSFEAIGAIITKTITPQPTIGSHFPRLHETASGLLFAIGLENPGIDVYLNEHVPYLSTLKTEFICSFAGKNYDEYRICIEKITHCKKIKIVEVNLSCPNVELECLPSQNAELSYQIISYVRKHFSGTVIAKLTPNVTDITVIAKSVEKAGADAITVANAHEAIGIDANRFQFLLGNVTGGLSGPAIKPLSQYAVFKAAQAKISIPIIGSGGIYSGLDAAEYFLLGAQAVQIGVANLTLPTHYQKIYDEFLNYCQQHQLNTMIDLFNKRKDLFKKNK